MAETAPSPDVDTGPQRHLRLLPELPPLTADDPVQEQKRQIAIRGMTLLENSYFQSIEAAFRWVGRQQKRELWEVIRGGRA